jgi:hypothetical protein
VYELPEDRTDLSNDEGILKGHTLNMFCNLSITLGFINEYYIPKILAHCEGRKKNCPPGCHILF